jgi:hypothetical protein
MCEMADAAVPGGSGVPGEFQFGEDLLVEPGSVDQGEQIVEVPLGSPPLWVWSHAVGSRRYEGFTSRKLMNPGSRFSFS